MADEETRPMTEEEGVKAQLAETGAGLIAVMEEAVEAGEIDGPLAIAKVKMLRAEYTVGEVANREVETAADRRRRANDMGNALIDFDAAVRQFKLAAKEAIRTVKTEEPVLPE